MLLTVLAPLPDRCPALASFFEISPTNDDGADSMMFRFGPMNVGACFDFGFKWLVSKS